MQDQVTAVADQDTILSGRESRLAVVLFELLKPQLEKMIDAKLDSFKESEITSLLDISLKEDFDIHKYTSEIEDIISDHVRYNITITSTID